MFLFVPLETLRKLLPFGLIGGFLYTWIAQFLAVDVFHRWVFRPDFLTVLGIPVFFVIGWFGVTLAYGYLLLRFPKYQIALVVFFAIVATHMNYAAIQCKAVVLSGWTLYDTFMFGLFSHVLNLYILKFMLKKEELGAPQP